VTALDMHMNEIAVRRSRLVLRWMTRPTQPSALSGMDRSQLSRTIPSRPSCRKQRRMLSVINWRRSLVQLSLQHLLRSTCRGEKIRKIG